MTQSDINSSSNRRWLYGFNVALLIIIAFVIISFICYLSNRFHAPSDWTKGGLYSLSGSTKNLLHDAAAHNHDYEILSLFRAGTVHQRQVMDLLEEYARASTAVKIEDASDASLDDIQKRIRTLYAGELKPYQEAVDSFDPLADDLTKFFKLEGANIGALAQKPGASPALIRDAANAQGSFTVAIPSHIAALQKLVRHFSDSATPDWTKITDILKHTVSQDVTSIEGLQAELQFISDPKQRESQLPPTLLPYFASAEPRYKEMLAKVTAYKDRLDKLPPLKVQDLLDTLQSDRAEDNILIIGPTAAKIIPTSDIFKPPASQSPNATDQFNGEQAISSAMLSLERPEKVKIVFVTTSPQNLTSAGGQFSEIADILRDSNFDVLEWSPPGPPANPNQPPPSPMPPAQGAGVVWVVFPPEAPNPQMMMMGMPPPNPQPIIDATRRHLAAGGQVLFLAEAASGFMGASSPGYAYAPLLKDYGIDVKSQYSAITEIHQQNPNTGQLVEQAVPGVLLQHYSDDQITQPLQSLTTIFAPMQGQSGPVGIPTVVAKAATVPAGVDVHIIIESPRSADNWATTSPQPDAKFDATRDMASPIPLAATATRKDPAGKESRVVVIGANAFAANQWLDQVGGVVMTNGGPQAIQAYPGNSELFRNAALWLAGYENMIAVSAKANAALRIGDISPAALLTIRILFFYVGLPLAALLAGGIVWFIRRK